MNVHRDMEEIQCVNQSVNLVTACIVGDVAASRKTRKKTECQDIGRNKGMGKGEWKRVRLDDVGGSVGDSVWW